MTHRPSLHLHHGCISVANMDRSIDFYSNVLGFDLESRQYVSGISAEIAFLVLGEDRLEIVCHDDARSLPDFAKDVAEDFQVIGTKHLSFGTDDPDRLHAFLVEQSVDDLTEVFDNNPTYKYFFFRDPDGIAIEIVSKKPQSAYCDAVQCSYP